MENTAFKRPSVALFVIHFCLTSFLFTGLTYVFMEGSLANAQIISLASITISLVIVSAAQPTIIQFHEANSNQSLLKRFITLLFRPFDFSMSLDIKKSQFSLVLLVIICLLGFNYSTLFISLNAVNFSSVNLDYQANFGRLLKQVFTLNILLSQLGGLFFQSMLAFFLGIMLNTELTFNSYIKCVGLSYIGYVISGIVLLVFSLANPIHFESLADLTATMSSSISHIAIGKLGEYWSLTILAILIYRSCNGKIGVYWSIFNSFFPSLMILLSSILFNKLISV